MPRVELPTTGKRTALIIATDQYKDPKLQRLYAPGEDAEALIRVLSDPTIGAFDVQTVINGSEREVRRQIFHLFGDAGLDDLLLLHFSCHGVRDQDGRLYFATVDTELDELAATALSSDYVKAQMDACRARKNILLLDCCYAGAFMRGLASRGGATELAIRERFEGRGRVVITAATSVQHAFEASSERSTAPSFFTASLVAGLETGAADLDEDGLISIDEAYRYLEDRIRSTPSTQTPAKWDFDVRGELFLARAPIRVRPISLGADLQTAILSPSAWERLSVIRNLEGLLWSDDLSHSAAGLHALERMLDDSDPQVVRAVARALKDYKEAGTEPRAGLSKPVHRTGSGGETTPWYKTAVFYELYVRGFQDGNGDGQGDFRGLTERLDYLHWLGIDCVILMPIWPSPLRDAGYDVSDHFSILQDYGSLSDFYDFLEAAHARGIRVIADMVMNHTGDQHPWFQESRKSGSAKRDWYVWSEDDQRYAAARVMIPEAEVSNWTWDHEAQAFYWHRFFSHQPDLNYDNPEVQQAMLEVIRFWLDIGLDGFRLPDIPYLFESEDTSSENLPETHEFLKRLRKEVDDNYPDRVLLTAANQPPPEILPYFGDGDESHIVLNFPLMPRMFMALRREDRTPIVEICRTPRLPDSAQWGLFLRNHDELTLEMVTDEERDYMYEEYAKDPRMRRNIGIARRLAPLLDNDRRQIELLYSLLFSLPGSPVMYYGDEIGMGDNIYFGDRDGVRTSMQWTGDRNAGFSRADPAALYLPFLMDPVYGYQACNIEAQERVSTSLLQWIRRLLQVRKQYPIFGLGDYESLDSSNRRVLAFVRRLERDVVLVLANLSRFHQLVTLDLRRWDGRIPEEMLGRSRLQFITTDPYHMMLGPYGFIWLQLMSAGLSHDLRR